MAQEQKKVCPLFCLISYASQFSEEKKLVTQTPYVNIINFVKVAFLQKYYAKISCTNSLCLYYFVERKLAKKLLLKCWLHFLPYDECLNEVEKHWSIWTWMHFRRIERTWIEHRTQKLHWLDRLSIIKVSTLVLGTYKIFKTKDLIYDRNPLIKVILF